MKQTHSRHGTCILVVGLIIIALFSIVILASKNSEYILGAPPCNYCKTSCDYIDTSDGYTVYSCNKCTTTIQMADR